MGGVGSEAGASNNEDIPRIDLIGPDGNEEPEDAGLFTPAQGREAAGLSDDGEIVAWRTQGFSKPVIIAYGPPNSRRYENSTAYKSGINFDERSTPKYGPDFRKGDEKRDKRYVRSYSEFKGILGEAYKGDVELLKPKGNDEIRKNFHVLIF